MSLRAYSQVELLRELLDRAGTTPAPSKVEFFGTHVNAVIGIGKDHHATITLDAEALEELTGKSEQMPDDKDHDHD